MTKHCAEIFKGIAMIFMAMLFFSCKDDYKRVGDEAKKEIFPQGVAENFVLTYTEMPDKLSSEEAGSSKILAVISGPIRNDFENLEFPHQTFPEGLLVEIFNEKNEKTTIEADYGIYYAATTIIDLQGNVVIKGHDGKKLEAPQLYYDRENEWAFTQEKFKFTNPEDGTVMDGEGMDIKKDLTFLNAHKTYGLMLIKEDKND
ncbi:LPS export ABC transporter periplasmic protein LptC [Maribacter sp. PR1]|uniref:LPS export ABC transporter periplasmic protein LptC n=1 Tax=Maribacter cobaltidurans TaxID=1178778 RepID=A0ABU7IUD4_9FLAO|nr:MULTISPECIES: LPS export ABC transporter periplasmic protein LptC [Maribacter]MDC6389177.1 LPS export ABC transporter periplasmic protein LptC [Maribacter sp. PR1]MEE1976564.1 LPS export ABC transporter periplasmic protein LptC [Maribacter cobaltidurans]